MIREILVGRRSLLRQTRGFTMIEVVAVLILLGILAAVVVSRGLTTSEVSAVSELDTLRGHLRFAQYRAMNDLPAIQWGISIGGSTYTLVRVDTSTNTTTSPINLPGESSATHTFSGVSASVTGNNPILFDEWGSPGANLVTVNIGSKTITITANTGFIP